MSELDGLDAVSAAIQILRDGSAGEIAKSDHIIGGRWDRPLEHFRDSLPVIIVRATPGAPARSNYLPVGHYNFDTFVYHLTYLQMTELSARVAWDLYDIEHARVQVQGYRATLVRCVNSLGGPSQLHDADVELPYVRQAWQMYVDDVEVVA